MNTKQTIALIIIGLGALAAAYYYVWLPARQRAEREAEDAAFLRSKQEDIYSLRQESGTITDVLGALETNERKTSAAIQETKFYLR